MNWRIYEMDERLKKCEFKDICKEYDAKKCDDYEYYSGCIVRDFYISKESHLIYLIKRSGGQQKNSID